MSPDGATVLSGLYDGEVKRADAAFGRLLDALAPLGLLDDTVVVFTSDHGEEFLDHGALTHGKTLYRELLHVPLIVRLPGGARGSTTVATPVQHVDLAASILALAGLPRPPGLDGDPILDGSRIPTREIFSHLDHDGRRVLAITDDRWVAIRTLAAPEGVAEPLEVYDLRHDPAERENVAGTEPVVTAYATERLAALAAQTPVVGPQVEPHQLERLRALGYVAP